MILLNLKENEDLFMFFSTSLATNDEEFEKLNDDPRPAPFSPQLYRKNQYKLKHPNQSFNYN